MKTCLKYAALAALLLAIQFHAGAQGTAFTYQGQLYDTSGGGAANGHYDLAFSLFDAVTNGNQAGETLTNLSTSVSNGLFTVTLDYGQGILTGRSLWLDISVRTNGGGNFTELVPRQPLTATPYAVTAGNAATYSGAIADSQLSANMARLNANQTFSGAVTFSSQSNAFDGSFAGSGTGLTNLQVSSLSSPVATVSAWGLNNDRQTNVPPGLNASNLLAIAAGSYHSLALKSDGTVVAWGWNQYGQTNVPAGLSGVIAIAAGYTHSLALRSGGTVTAWGDNTYGEISVPAGLNNVVAVAAGGGYSMALRNDGTVVAWGFFTTANIPASFQSNVAAICCSESQGAGGNNLALKNNGTVVNWNGATPPFGLSNVVAVAAAGNGSMALKNDGTIVTWGSLAAPPATNNVVGIAAGYLFGLAVKNDGTVISWGDNTYGQTNAPSGLGSVIAVAAGAFHALALHGTGSYAPARLARLDQVNAFTGVDSFSNPNDSFAGSGAGLNTLQVSSLVNQTAAIAAWGNNANGQTNVPALLSSSNFVAVAGGFGHSLGLKSDGTVAAWGLNNDGQTNVPAGLHGVVAIAAGYYHSLALTSDGTVVAWGDNTYGELNVPAGLNNVVAVTGGQYTSMALKNDGTVVVWGSPNYMNIPPNFQSNIVAISQINAYSLALKANGTVVAWNGSTPPTGLSNVVAVAASGNGGGLALKSDGTITTWGGLAPPPITNGVAGIASGFDFGVALNKDGTVMVWGDSSYNLTTYPVNLGGVVTVAAGSYHALALRGTGLFVPARLASLNQVNAFTGINSFANPNDSFTGSGAGLNTLQVSSLVNQTAAVAAWGNNGNGQTNVPAILSSSNFVAVAGGYGHSLALKSDGTVAAWGLNNDGQTNVPVGLHGVVAIAAGYYHSLALTCDGTVAAWGDNTYGEINVPAGLDNVVAVTGGQYTSMALENNGTVVVWGSSSYTNIPANFQSNIVAISQFNTTSLALKANGTVVAWNGATPPFGLSNVVAVAVAGNGGGLALKSDGTIATWGSLAPPPATNGVASIAAGLDFGVALNKDGTVMVWGDPSYNLTSYAVNLGGVVAVAAGYYHALALRGTGIFVPARLASLNQVNDFTGVNSFANPDDSFAGNGAGLTALNASNLSSGTVADALLSTNVAFLDANQTFTGANTLGNASNVFVGSFTGDGGNLTNLNASQISSGTIPPTQLPGIVLTNNATNIVLGGLFTGAFSGDGRGLANVSANAITGGLTTNISVLVPGGATITLCFTNGILSAVQ